MLIGALVILGLGLLVRLWVLAQRRSPGNPIPPYRPSDARPNWWPGSPD